jgi:large subunit ribosomal protein L23
MMKFDQSIIKKMRVSEKASQSQAGGKYIFDVLKSANKISVKHAVEQQYQVKVTQVNIVNNQGKDRRYGASSGRTSDFKKAIVTLKEGQKIE